MDQTRIDEIKARVKYASPGQWFTEHDVAELMKALEATEAERDKYQTDAAHREMNEHSLAKKFLQVQTDYAHQSMRMEQLRDELARVKKDKNP